MSEHVNLRVPEPDLKEWDEHVDREDTAYPNRSKLIKHAVRQQIKRDTGQVGESGDTRAQTAQTGASTERVDKLVETVERMSNQIETLEDSVEDATRAMRSGGTVSEDTATEVFAALPDGPANARSTHWIAEEADLGHDLTRVALEQLAETTAAVSRARYSDVETDDSGRVVAGDGHDGPRWFKEA